MIFCGAPIDQQVIQEEYTAPTKNLLPELCVKYDDQVLETIDEVIQIEQTVVPIDPPPSTTTHVFGPLDDANSEQPRSRLSTNNNKILSKHALSKALDKIDETIAVDCVPSKQESPRKASPRRSPTQTSLSTTHLPTSRAPRRRAPYHHIQQRTRSSASFMRTTDKFIRPPVRSRTAPSSSRWKTTKYDSSPMASPVDEPLEKLIERLEDGFRVTLLSGPFMRELGGMNLLFFLNQDRRRIMVESFMYVDENRQDGESSIAIQIRDIVKIEVREGRRGKNCFFIHESTGRELIKCFEFEASSKWEREVIISALLVILDQVNSEQQLNEIEQLKTMQPVTQVYEEEENVVVGTQSKPIVCNPSLEDEEVAIISPLRPTRIIDSDKGTEASLIVLPDMQSQCSRRTIRSAVSQGIPLPECVEIPGPTLDSNKSLGEQPPSQEITACNSHSQLVANGNWCTDDVCSNALRDIAETCAGIFGRQQDVVSSPLSTGLTCQVDQQLALEEYIATALDAPNVMYSYLVEGDTWNAGPVDNSAEQSSPSSGHVRRRIQNRANLLNAQASRLRNLRNEMTFASAFKRSKEMKFLSRAQSFDDAHIFSSQRRQQQATSKGAEKLHASPLIQNIVEALALDEPGAVSSEGEEVAYYDSDPEDMEPRAASDRGLVYFDRIDRARQVVSKPECHLKTRGLDKIPLGKKVKKLDEESVVDIVQVSFNMTISPILRILIGFSLASSRF